MKLTIILPAYNEEALILRALKSIPTSKDYQLILINDGSTDNTPTLMKKWLEKNKDKFGCAEYYDKKNGGVASAMNLGFDKAVGEYIISLSADDYYATNFERFMPYLDGKNDLVYFDLQVNDMSVWRVDETTKNKFVGAVKFIRREFLSDTRIPEDVEFMEDVPFNQALQKKKPTEAFTYLVLKHYNFPHEGSLIWRATHKEKK